MDISADKLGLHIEGVFWDNKKPMAIVNGEIVGEGDVIKGMEVVTILKKSLRLKRGTVLYHVLY